MYHCSFIHWQGGHGLSGPLEKGKDSLRTDRRLGVVLLRVYGNLVTKGIFDPKQGSKGQKGYPCPPYTGDNMTISLKASTSCQCIRLKYSILYNRKNSRHEKFVNLRHRPIRMHEIFANFGLGELLSFKKKNCWKILKSRKSSGAWNFYESHELSRISRNLQISCTQILAVLRNWKYQALIRAAKVWKCMGLVGEGGAFTWLVNGPPLYM